ncbi:MAG: sulfide/dihydroorotate dehydrogenase-like FAD/NAD-binding protein [Candidatus Aminicenantes bacterium]|nr:sulfide/dihydroorotate dehydrogenase-like FAD/NAD-binding protein [Candidatus Aminicenantes bacterium]
MFEVIEREKLVPNLHLLTVRAPQIVETIKPGQFVIFRSDEKAERIPLSVADWDREAGTLTTVFMVVGASTEKLSSLKTGDTVPTVVGPLGRPTEIDNFGSVVCIGGCYGMGSLFPTIKALDAKGNDITVVYEARSHNLLYWADKVAPFCSRFISITRDGSSGFKGHIDKSVEILDIIDLKPDRVIANGCTFSVYKAAKDYARYDVPIIVSLNTIMIDGTGMCGVCRVTVDNKMKFACVDGPDFDGRRVDWEELFKRRKQYLNEEAFLVHNSGCGGIK